MNWETITIILGALGGWEAIKYLINLRWNKKIIKVQSKNDEFELLKKTNEFLQTQLLEKEQRFAEQTQLVRRLNADIVDSINKDRDQTQQIGDIMLQLQFYKYWHCQKDDCLNRRPPHAVKMKYTPLEKQEKELKKMKTKGDPKMENIDKVKQKQETA